MTKAPASIVQLEAVGLRYGDAAPALHEVDLRLQAGSFHFLSGPTGAGKTSLLRLLSLSLPPSMGTIWLFGQETATLDRAALAPLRRRIGVVFQDFRLLEHLSAFDNVALPLRINGADEAETARFVADMLGWLGLGDKLEALPADLSMGQRQMICIARAVVGKPRLLLADEPTSNIDARNAERLMNLFIQLHKLGAAVVFATHSEALMDRYAFPVLEMRAGRLCAARPEPLPPPPPPQPPVVEPSPDREGVGSDATKTAAPPACGVIGD